jgi:hypothetical protein
VTRLIDDLPGEPRLGFTHVYGAPGISACTLMTR